MNGTPEDEDDVGDVIPFRTSSSEDRSTEGRSPEERDPEGGSREGHSPEGRPPESHSPEGPSPEDRSPEGRSPEGPSLEGRSPEGGFPEGGFSEESGLPGKAFGEGARQGPPEAEVPGGPPGAADASEAEVIPLPAAHRRRAVRKVGLLAAGLLAGALALGAGAIVVLRPYLSPDDFDGPGSGTVTVRIAPGSSAQAIGSVLADAGVVASAGSFVNVTEDRAVSDRLRPGHYRLRKGMAAGAALDLLLSPAARIVRRVAVPEGMRVTEVFDRLARQAGLTLQALKSVDQALVGLPAYAKGLEGFLFPATYEIEPGDTAVDVLAAMAERFAAAARQVGLEEQAPRLNLTPLQVVTLASMIQAEGGTDEDYPKISRVIYNRLARNMPLEIDSTVLYAQNRRTLRVTERDTKVNSPYNTYRHKGLPPGPIANPGEKALMAALNPAEGDWQWFVTTDPRHRITKFTSKESEFVRYREELNKNLGAS